MDDLIGLLAEQISKRIRVAQDQAAAAQAARSGLSPPPSGANPAGRRGPARPAVPGGSAAVVPGGVPAPRPASAVGMAEDASLLRRLRRDMPADPPAPAPLAGPAPLALAALPAATAPVGGPQPAPALLAAFRGGTPLLASIVLAEALAPPLALQPFDARRR